MSFMPTVRYSYLQGSYWFSFSVAYCFVSVFLLANGYSNSEIGAVFAIGGFIAAILQPLIGNWINEYGRFTMRRVIMIGSIFIMISAALLCVFSKQQYLFGLHFTLVTIGLQTLMPFVNAISMECLNRGISVNFGLARGIGSICYAIASYGMGKLISRYTEGILPYGIIFAFMLVLIAAYFFTYRSLERYAVDHDANECASANEGANEDVNHSNTRFFVRYPRFLIFLFGVGCIFITHNIINTYLFQICHSLGGGAEEYGIAGSLCAAIELPTMMLFMFMKKRIKSVHLLYISAIFFTLKAVMHLLAFSMIGVYIAQLPQILGFALFIPASTYYANEIMDRRDGAIGQAYLTSANTTGCVLGSSLGGVILDRFGISVMLCVAIATGLLGLLFFIMGTQKSKTA